MTDNAIMRLGWRKAHRTMRNKIGGPFGAVIVKDNEIVAISSNTVLRDNDPTAHAEINAIREACKELGTYDLSDCVLYATGEPCPMCLSAIIWANISKVYYMNPASEAAKIGFRDTHIYEFIRSDMKDKDILDIKQLNIENGTDLYKDYMKYNFTMY